MSHWLWNLQPDPVRAPARPPGVTGQVCLGFPSLRTDHFRGCSRQRGVSKLTKPCLSVCASLFHLSPGAPALKQCLGYNPAPKERLIFSAPAADKHPIWSSSMSYITWSLLSSVNALFYSPFYIHSLYFSLMGYHSISPSMTSSFLPQGLCICCSLCLGCSPFLSHGWWLLIQLARQFQATPSEAVSDFSYQTSYLPSHG